MNHTGRRVRPFPVLCLLFLAAVACGIPGTTPTEKAPTRTPTLLQPTDTPAETALPVTDTPVPPTKTPTVTPSPALSAWLFVYGTWSGCVDDPTPLVPSTATSCSAPSGDFVTLFLKPHCVIGEYCGNYVKGTFQSEFILLKLTLLGIQGSTVWMHGDAGSGLFSWASTDVTIESVGNAVQIAEQAAQEYIFVMPKGCDPVIQADFGAGCFEYLV